MYTLINDDCLNALNTFDDNRFHSLICDPPYGLSEITLKNTQDALRSWLNGQEYESKKKGFDDHKWDSFVPSPKIWEQVLRVMKEGALGLVFSSTRNIDLMGISLRLAGFEVIDSFVWLFGGGGGFNGLNIGKGGKKQGESQEFIDQWDGFKTKLKTSHEPILVIRKPIKTASNYVENIKLNSTGAFNEKDCLIGGYEGFKGRKPTNVLIDESVKDILDAQSGRVGGYHNKTTVKPKKAEQVCFGSLGMNLEYKGDTRKYGGASKFFYCSKASRKEKELGLTSGSRDHWRGNIHPTVKPLDLMDYLCKLITPPNSLILDPFMGSGSTGCSSQRTGFDFVGIELKKEYYEIAQKRIKYWSQFGVSEPNPPLKDQESKEPVQLKLF